MTSPPNKDAVLLKNCLSGVPGAWDAFVERFAPYLAEVCQRTLKRCGRPFGPAEVDDMLQEVFLHIFRNNMHVLKVFRGQASPAAYLAVVAVNRVLGDRSERIDLGSPPAYESLPEPVSQEPGPATSMETREHLDLLRKEIGLLPPKTGLALTLHGRGASLREVAQAMGVSEDAIAQLLSRGRAMLADRMKIPKS